MVCILALIGAVDAAIVTFFVTVYRGVAHLVGANLAPSHGLYGFGLVVLTIVAAFIVLLWPRIGGILLLVAGVALFFVLHWWALLASPQLLIGGVLALMSAQEALPGPHEREHPLAPPAATPPPLPAT
jgi:hypothetical protein